MDIVFSDRHQHSLESIHFPHETKPTHFGFRRIGPLHAGVMKGMFTLLTNKAVKKSCLPPTHTITKLRWFYCSSFLHFLWTSPIIFNNNCTIFTLFFWRGDNSKWPLLKILLPMPSSIPLIARIIILNCDFILCCVGFPSTSLFWLLLLHLHIYMGLAYFWLHLLPHFYLCFYCLWGHLGLFWRLWLWDGLLCWLFILFVLVHRVVWVGVVVLGVVLAHL